MNSPRVLVARLVSLFVRRRRDTELSDEIQAHLDALTEEYVRRGMSADRARAAARRAFGGVMQMQESYRDQRGWPFFDVLAQDVRYAFRTLDKNRGFTAVAILILALGIGANTAIFSVLNAVVLRTLPVADPSELYSIRQEARTTTPGRFSYGNFVQLRDAVAGAGGQVAGMSRVARMQALVQDSRSRETVNVQLVSGEYFSVLGVSPAMGRALSSADNERVGGHPVAVVSDGFWRRRLGGAADVVGREVTLNATQFAVIGVGPPGFSGVTLESPVDLWIPLVMQGDVHYAQNFSADRSDTDKPWVPQPRIWWIDLIVRARSTPDIVAAALNAGFRPTLAAAAATIGDPERRRRFLEQRLVLGSFEHGFSALRLRFATPLYVLLGMVSFILIIACLNTANLLFARASSRRREMAVRLAIGASGRRLVRQSLTESFVLVALAATIGVVLARWTSDTLIRLTLATPVAPFTADLDGRVLAFTIVISIATAVLAGFAPARRAAQVPPAAVLRGATRDIVNGARLNGPKLAVALQVALSLALVIGAGLFAQSFRNFTKLDLGYDRDRVLTVWVNPRLAGYQPGELRQLYERLTERLEAVPGVHSATFAMCGVAVSCRSRSDGVQVMGYQTAPNERVLVQFNYVGPRYLSTLGMRLVEGRDFSSDDFERSTKVAIINEAFARRYFRAGKAIGGRFGEGTLDTEVVGIVHDARVNLVQEAAEPMAFQPIGRIYGAPGDGGLDVRTDGDPRSLVGSARAAVAAVDPDLPVERVTILAEQARGNLSQERVIAALTTAFGSLALGLACVGLFGVMSYHVSRRTPEFGVRLALGAPRASVLWMMFRESLALVAIGIALGLPAVLATGQFVAAQLFEIRANDPALIATATIALTTVAAAAGFVPAWRASRVDPIVALRSE
jgi:predicted permease